ncbi:unnamed protein product, partial [Meganyctiphanes norvegica]
MSDFKNLITLKPTTSIHLQRETALIELDSKFQMLNELDTNKPSIRIFSRIEGEVNEALHTLEKTNSAFISSLVKANPEIKLEDSFKEDQKYIRNEQFKCINAIEAYTELLTVKGINYPSDSKSGLDPSDLADILKQTTQLTNKLITKQDENIDKILKNNTSGAPKPSQPYFTSRQIDADFAAFKDFWSRFEHFTKKVVSPSDKLEWLKS